MKSTIIKGLFNALVSIIGASLIIFVISRLSGDPVSLLLPIEAPKSAIDELRKNLGLDLPIWQQYLDLPVARGAAAISATPIAGRCRRCSSCSSGCRRRSSSRSAAFAFSVMLAIPLGVLSAVYRGSWIDHVGRIIAMTGQAVPSFWVGLMLILVFAVGLGWLPAFGADSFKHVILPAISLGWYPVAAQTRIIRSGMLEVLDSDYIRMGRAVGTPERLLIWKYAFRNALLPLVTIMGVYFAAMLSGAFVVETVFAWPGLGRTVVEAVFARDYPVVQAGVLVTSIVFILSNFLVDLSYSLIDPRIRR